MLVTNCEGNSPLVPKLLSVPGECLGLLTGSRPHQAGPPDMIA